MHCPISKDHTKVLIGSTDRLNIYIGRQVPILHMYNLSHQVNLLRSPTAHMAVSGWWVADDPLLAQLKCASTMCGVQYVIMDGTEQVPMLPVAN